MNLRKKISLAIIADKRLPTSMLLDYCAGHIRLTDEHLHDLERVCDTIIANANEDIYDSNSL